MFAIARFPIKLYPLKIKRLTIKNRAHFLDERDVILIPKYESLKILVWKVSFSICCSTNLLSCPRLVQASEDLKFKIFSFHGVMVHLTLRSSLLNAMWKC